MCLPPTQLNFFHLRAFMDTRPSHGNLPLGLSVKVSVSGKDLDEINIDENNDPLVWGTMSAV